ncbi:hypothetical protein PR048_004234 [Dryococelus australis]|uniref:Uncharacterized protein n=1 Tax=Dryococelus australis TaxID=614101 RepID=A0ABQ9I4X2_9NEOP|nr:hypothetical protein PR048_004234 [Dryococelus australis]
MYQQGNARSDKSNSQRQRHPKDTTREEVNPHVQAGRQEQTQPMQRNISDNYTAAQRQGYFANQEPLDPRVPAFFPEPPDELGELVEVIINTVVIGDTDREFLLQEPAEEIVNSQEMLYPELLLEVCGIRVRCFLDSGAEISCISENMVNRIRESGNKLPIVLVPRLKITGATSRATPVVKSTSTHHWPDKILGVEFLTQHKIKKGLIQVSRPVIASVIATPADIYQAVASIESLNRCQKASLERLLFANQLLLSEKPGCNKSFKADVQVIPRETFCSKSYTIPANYVSEAEEYLKLMLSWNTVKHASSPYCNPVVCVRNKDGSVRLCLDARQLND